ncbi:MAG TPA: hypothetical protein VFK92_04155 [Burkholderiales bacterium]|nr:hypothetical protein [Burkholderiales bacterium]
MLSKRDLKRAVRHGERDLRAAGGDMLSQLSPHNIVRDARDLALKFARDEVLHSYIGPRIWAVIGVVLVFVLVSSVCAIDVMIKTGRFVPGIVALLLGAAAWAGGVVGQIYVFAIWLEGRAVQRDRGERGIDMRMPAGFLAYLKYSRALVPWILVTVCVALPLLAMALRVPVVALLLLAASALAPFLFRKFAD